MLARRFRPSLYLLSYRLVGPVLGAHVVVIQKIFCCHVVRAEGIELSFAGSEPDVLPVGRSPSGGSGRNRTFLV